MTDNEDPEKWDELEKLLANCVDDDQSAEDQIRLNEILRDNPLAQRRAVKVLFNESVIRGEFGVSRREEIYGVSQKSAELWWSRGVFWRGVAAASIVIAGFVTWSLQRKGGNRVEPVGREVIEEKPIAIVVQQRGDGLSGANGQAVKELDLGHYQMDEGSAELAFRNGVQAVIQGPVDFTIESDMQITLRAGRIRARVPSNATGFTIDAPEVDVVDLGTEFGVYVSENRETEVHVFSGEVELHEENRNGSRIVTEGFAANWRDGRGVTDFSEPDPEAFLTSADLREEERELLKQELIGSPHTVLFYDFQEDPKYPNLLVNRNSPRRHNGKVIGASWVQGRFPQSRALLFENTKDRVAVTVPGDFEEATLGVWLKVDRFDFSLTAIFNADGYDKRECHWQILDDGGLRAAAGGNLFRFTTSDQLVQPGRWTHLVMTYDTDAMICRQYVDGVLVHEKPLKKKVPIRFRNSNLGYWGQSFGWPKERGFRGRMDEFLIQNRAMEPEEIAKLYQVGRPADW